MHITLAPMEGVVDHLMRDMLTQIGGYDLCVTEFVRVVDAKLPPRVFYRLCPELHHGGVTPSGVPVKVQLLGQHPQWMAENAVTAVELGSHGVDINFGCPVKKVVSKGAGAGILRDIDLMVSLTEAMVKHTKLPITVKTRLGWDHDSIKIVEVAERLQDVGCQAIAIHGRTRAQMYKGEADWRPIAEVKNNPRMHIPIFGNGDVDTPERAAEMRDQYGLDGAMIGRASIGNPWFFKQVKHYFETGTHAAPPTLSERVAAARRHLEMSIDWKGEQLGVFETRRHYTNYFKGIPDFKPYRTRLVTSDASKDVFATLDEIEQEFGAIVFTH